MAVLRFEDITPAVMREVLNSLETPVNQYQAFFPAEYSSSLTWQSLKTDGNITVSADVIAHDASAHLKERPELVKQMGDINKISILNRVEEKRLHDYFALVNSKSISGAEQQIFNIIFGDIKKSYDGVHMRLENLGMQALSTGVAKTTSSDNLGITVTATYGIPAGNKTGTSGAIWATAATATPITDLRKMKVAAQNKGLAIVKFLMRRSTFDKLRLATETKNLYSGYLGLNAGTLAPTIDNVNIVLSGEGLPPIQLVDSTVNIEDKAGNITSLNPFSEYNVVGMTSATAGVTSWTQTAEEKGGIQNSGIAVNRDIVRVTRWNEFNPYRVLTKGESVAFPVLNNVDGIFLLNTNKTGTYS